jgi:Protein of unknown function (DUF2795)
MLLEALQIGIVFSLTVNRNNDQHVNMSRENRDQIPTEHNEAQTQNTARRQENISGEQREKSVNDFPKAAALGQALKEINFPADKKTIMNFVEQSTSQRTREILPLVQRLEDRKYNNVSEVAEAAKLVS